MSEFMTSDAELDAANQACTDASQISEVVRQHLSLKRRGEV
jgi:hypothetical protein